MPAGREHRRAKAGLGEPKKPTISIFVPDEKLTGRAAGSSRLADAETAGFLRRD
jgi:hypothetical protein